MSKKKKPDWLIDAEKAIKKFDASEWGKATSKQITNRLNASLGAKSQLKSGTHNFQTMDSDVRAENARNAGVFKDSELQKENSRKSHLKKLETGYYEKNKEMHAALAKDLDQPWKCEYCGKEGRGIGNFKRYGHHNGSCKTKKVLRKSTIIARQKLQDTLPDEFSVKEAKSYSSELKISTGVINKWIKEECIKIHEGTNGSPTDVAIYRKPSK